MRPVTQKDFSRPGQRFVCWLRCTVVASHGKHAILDNGGGFVAIAGSGSSEYDLRPGDEVFVSVDRALREGETDDQGGDQKA